MTINESKLDRAARMALGIALLLMVVFGPRTLWGLVGLIPLATGFFGVCPIYSAFGLSTCPADRRARS